LKAITSSTNMEISCSCWKESL